MLCVMTTHRIQLAQELGHTYTNTQKLIRSLANAFDGTYQVALIPGCYFIIGEECDERNDYEIMLLRAHCYSLGRV